jgi:hypothetical protein
MLILHSFLRLPYAFIEFLHIDMQVREGKLLIVGDLHPFHRATS